MMESFSGLLNNSALMLVLCVIYDTFNIHAIPNKHLRELVTGVIVGLITIAVMFSPWSLQPGVFFDTRWVLLSLCGLFFGFNTTVLAVIIAGAFRLYQGGAGGVVGTLVIVSTAFTGLAWRYGMRRYNKSLDWKYLYLFGVSVQLVMLGCMVFMPRHMLLTIYKNVAPPILLIYPILTLIIGLVLKRQEARRTTDTALIKEMKERKAAEKAARKSQEEWEKTFNSITDIVTLLDPLFHILKINNDGRKAVQKVDNEIVGRHCYELFHNRTEPCSGCPLVATVQTLKPRVREIKNHEAGRTYLVSSAPVLDESGRLTHLAHVAKDITESKRLEDELFQAQKIESIGTLAGGIAHDFNNILSAIMGYAELARFNIPKGNKAIVDIDQILLSSQRAADLIRQILTFSRKSKHYLEPLSPHLIVKETLKMLRASLPTTIRIQEDIDVTCGRIMVDPTNMQQIVINLCTNALHAMENEKGILTIRLFAQKLEKSQISQETGETAGEFVVLQVCDTGHGMDTATIAQIFEPYFTTKDVGKGTGLGLSVIHGIVKDYHGFIRVESTLSKGSTFSVFIPVLQKKTTVLKTEVPKYVASLSGTEHLLMVDDEVQLLDVNKLILERFGYKVTTVSQSREAFEMFDAAPESFDLVVSDQTMPEMTGVELARKILNKRPDIPVILCTGYSSIISEENVLEIGVRQLLRKPINTNELARIVRRHLDENKKK